MNTMVKLGIFIKNNSCVFANTIKDAYKNKPVEVKFYNPNSQLKFVEDDSIFVVGTNIVIDDNNTCYLGLKKDIDSKLKSFLLQNASDLILVLDLDYSFENDSCYITNIKSAEVLFKKDTNVIAKEWTELDPMKNVKCICVKCNRPFEVSIHRPEYRCSCGSTYAIEKMYNAYYGAGYMVKDVSKI